MQTVYTGVVVPNTVLATGGQGGEDRKHQVFAEIAVNKGMEEVLWENKETVERQKLKVAKSAHTKLISFT